MSSADTTVHDSFKEYMRSVNECYPEKTCEHHVMLGLLILVSLAVFG